MSDRRHYHSTGTIIQGIHPFTQPLPLRCMADIPTEKTAENWQKTLRGPDAITQSDSHARASHAVMVKDGAVSPSKGGGSGSSSSPGHSSDVTKGNKLNTQGLAAHIQSLGWEDQSCNFHDVVVMALGKVRRGAGACWLFDGCLVRRE